MGFVKVGVNLIFTLFTCLREKVCVFFTLLLLNLSTAGPRIFGKSSNRDFILCLDSFSRHIHEGLFIDGISLCGRLLYLSSSLKFLIW